MTAECGIQYVIRTCIDFPEIQRKRAMLLIGRLHLFLARANIRGLYKVMKFFDIIMEEARKYFSRRDMIYLPLASKSLASIDRGRQSQLLTFYLPTVVSCRLFIPFTFSGLLEIEKLRHVPRQSTIKTSRFYRRIFMFAFGFVFRHYSTDRKPFI